MALNFPDNPTIGQQYTDPNNLVWEFNGVVWNPITGTSGISGFSGSSGYSGYSGTSGYSGITGISGFSGTSSATISASDEGNLLTSIVSGFNFAGINVVTTNVGGAVTVTIEPPPVYINSAWGWGYNNVGQLATNNTTGRSSPVSVLGGFTDWCQISAGVTTTIAIRTNGTAWAWGAGINGTLGDNTTVNKSSPVSVVGGFTDWCQVSAGGNRANNARSAVAVRQNGTAWAWGYNGEGALGDNTTVDKSSPVSVVGGFTDWCQVVTRSGGAAGIRTNGTLWSWGLNSNGQLGDNTITGKSSPVSVVGGFTDWCQVAGTISQFSQILAVRTNGTLWAWGAGSYGQLGDNTTVSKSSPVSVVGGFTNWCRVSGGDKFSQGVRQNGTLWAWGYNSAGQLGDNTCGVCRSSPVSVVGGFTDWCQASGGQGFANAVRQNGTAWSWGSGNYGRLGDDLGGYNRSSPVSVVGGFTDWCQISAGFRSAAGLRSSIV